MERGGGGGGGCGWGEWGWGGGGGGLHPAPERLFPCTVRNGTTQHTLLISGVGTAQLLTFGQSALITRSAPNILNAERRKRSSESVA